MKNEIQKNPDQLLTTFFSIFSHDFMKPTKQKTDISKIGINIKIIEKMEQLVLDLEKQKKIMSVF